MEQFCRPIVEFLSSKLNINLQCKKSYQNKICFIVVKYCIKCFKVCILWYIKRNGQYHISAQVVFMAILKPSQAKFTMLAYILGKHLENALIYLLRAIGYSCNAWKLLQRNL